MGLWDPKHCDDVGLMAREVEEQGHLMVMLG